MSKDRAQKASSKFQKSRRVEAAAPFPGLRAYGEQDAEFYVGRQRLKYPLLKKLSEDFFVSVQGANGVGKTSFVNCLVLPELKAGYISGGQKDWKLASLKPGKNPVAALAAALASPDIVRGKGEVKIDPNLSDKFEKILSTQRYGLIDIVEEFGLSRDSNILIYIDQLDELTSYSDPNSAAIFIERIVEAANQTAYPIHILTSSRSEVDGEFAIYPRFAELINRNNFLLPQIDRSELMSLFDKITYAGALSFRPALIDHVVEYYKDHPMDVGKFQHALKRTVDEVKAERGVKTIGPLHLKTIGGLEGSIGLQLEEIFFSLDPSDQETCVLMFKALTKTSFAGLQQIQRRTLEKLCELTDRDQESLIRVIKAFAPDACQAIKVNQSSDIQGKLTGLDIIHSPIEDRFTPYTEIQITRDLIVAAWPRLAKWVEEDAADAAIYIEIAESARKKEHVYQGEKLKSTLAWYGRKDPKAGWALQYHSGFIPAIDFIQSSEKSALREVQIRKAEELSRQQKSARNKKMLAGFILVAIVLIIYSGFETEKAIMANIDAAEADSLATASAIQAKKDSLAGVDAREMAAIAMYKADTSRLSADTALLEAKLAKDSARILSRKSQALSAEVYRKQGLLESAEAEMKKSRLLEEYLNVLKTISVNSESAQKILTRTDDKAQLKDGAEIASEAFILFQRTKSPKFAAVRDSALDVTALAQKKLFSTMNLAIQKVKSSPKLSEIVGGVITKKVIGVDGSKANGIFFIGTNDIFSSIYRVHIVNGEVEIVDKLAEAYSTERNTQGIKAMAVAHSKEHFIVSHIPTQQNVRFLSSFTIQGEYGSSTKFENSVEYIWPVGSNEFLVLDQYSSIHTLLRQESGIFNPNLLRRSRNQIVSADFNEESELLVLAHSNRNIEMLKIAKSKSPVERLKIQLDEFKTEITAIKYLPNQDWFVVGNRNGELYFYDAIDGSLVYQALNEHANNVNCLEISPNGTIMVSGGRDKTVNIWKLDELKKKLEDLGPVEEKYAPIQFVETESIRDVDFVNNDWILVVSSSEGLSNNQSGDVSLLPLDFDVTGRELKKLVE